MKKRYTSDERKKILLGAARRIEANGGREYRQDRFFCGSAGCLAYHIAVVMNIPLDQLAEAEFIIQTRDILPQWLWSIFAAEVVDEEDGEILAYYWPHRYARMYLRAKTRQERAKAAAGLLRAIAAGKVKRSDFKWEYSPNQHLGRLGLEVE